MIAIAIRFPAGYHATPWGHHPNEGVVEWPPSPWRFLRALTAVWYRTLEDRIPSEQLLKLLGAISAPPGLYLPPAASAHSRHYMPIESGRQPKSTLVFDTFVSLEDGAEVAFVWPEANLEAQARADLGLLLDRLGYLGRAESWCRARLAAPDSVEPNCWPFGEHEGAPEGHELVRILVADGPPDLKSLTVETSEVRGSGRAAPPGARWGLYARRQDAFSVRPRVRAAPRTGSSPPVLAIYDLDSTALPPIQDAIDLGELARRALMRLHRERSETLSGKDAAGRPLEAHRHAFYLPAAEGRSGRLDRLYVYAAAGFGPSECNVLGRLRALDRGGGLPPLHTCLAWIGPVEGSAGRLLGPARQWRSATPFVPMRHAKWRGNPKRLRDGPEEQVRLELSRRGLPEPIRVEPLDAHRRNGHLTRWLEFRRWRRNGGGGLGACGFRLAFDRAVTGPLALGFAAHYGLGLFVPDE